MVLACWPPLVTKASVQWLQVLILALCDSFLLWHSLKCVVLGSGTHSPFPHPTFGSAQASRHALSLFSAGLCTALMCVGTRVLQALGMDQVTVAAPLGLPQPVAKWRVQNSRHFLETSVSLLYTQPLQSVYISGLGRKLWQN